MSMAQHTKAHEEDAASSAPAVAAVIEERESGPPSDIDVNRLSSISSVSSGLASLRSLAQRIARRPKAGNSLKRNSSDDLPSSVMDWNRSSSSLQLFRRLSFSSSIASSQMMYKMDMSMSHASLLEEMCSQVRPRRMSWHRAWRCGIGIQRYFLYLMALLPLFLFFRFVTVHLYDSL